MPKKIKPQVEGEISIVTDVPLPKRSCGPRGSQYLKAAESMKVGNAVFFPSKSPALTIQKHLNRMHGKGSASVRMFEGEWGCWRVK